MDLACLYIMYSSSSPYVEKTMSIVHLTIYQKPKALIDALTCP